MSAPTMKPRPIAVRFTALQAGEIAHKLCILRDEDDLLDSYELDRQQAADAADVFLKGQPGGMLTFDAAMVDAILGELDNSVEIVESNMTSVPRSGVPELLGYISSMRAAQRKIRRADLGK